MVYEVKLSSDEKIVQQVDQDLAGKGFFFWRKFNIVLTNKRLHAYQKFILSYNQKTFDLANIDSIYQERKFNGGCSFFLGFILFGFMGMIGALLQFALLGEKSNSFIIISIFYFVGIILGITTFIMFFFKRQLVVHSKNDKMLIDVIRMPKDDLESFVEAVLHQKELSARFHITSNSPSNIADKLVQIKELRDKGLITENEFEKKKNDIINNI